MNAANIPAVGVRFVLMLAAWSALAAPCFADQSVRLREDISIMGRFPETHPNGDIGPYRVEFRVHNWKANARYMAIFRSTLLTVQFAGGSEEMVITNEIDDFGGDGNSYRFDVQGRTDFLVRYQRDPDNRIMKFEVWNVDGSNYRIFTKPIGSVRGAQISGNYWFGAYGPIWCDLAYFRIYLSLVPDGSPPPGNVKGGDLVDWEFEGDSDDSGPQRLRANFGNAGLPDFVKTPGPSGPDAKSKK